MQIVIPERRWVSMTSSSNEQCKQEKAWKLAPPDEQRFTSRWAAFSLWFYTFFFSKKKKKATAALYMYSLPGSKRMRRRTRKAQSSWSSGTLTWSWAWWRSRTGRRAGSGRACRRGRRSSWRACRTCSRRPWWPAPWSWSGRSWRSRTLPTPTGPCQPAIIIEKQSMIVRFY